MHVCMYAQVHTCALTHRYTHARNMLPDTGTHMHAEAQTCAHKFAHMPYMHAQMHMCMMHTHGHTRMHRYTVHLHIDAHAHMCVHM